MIELTNLITYKDKIFYSFQLLEFSSPGQDLNLLYIFLYNKISKVASPGQKILIIGILIRISIITVDIIKINY